MGGRQSTQSAEATAQVAARAVQSTVKDCINVAYGANSTDVQGAGNVVTGVTQGVSLSVNAACPAFTEQASEFRSSLASSVSQALKDTQVAMTQWLDNSGSDQATRITQNVSTSFTQSAVQKCVNSLNGYNAVSVGGTGNTLRDVAQEASLSVIAQCLSDTAQTNQAIADVTNSINQHSEYSSNPFSFISDAAAAVSRSVLALAALGFVLLVVLVAVVVMLRRGRRAAAAPAPRRATPAAA